MLAGKVEAEGDEVAGVMVPGGGAFFGGSFTPSRKGGGGFLILKPGGRTKEDRLVAGTAGGVGLGVGNGACGNPPKLALTV